jgi:hypothetical protein
MKRYNNCKIPINTHLIFNSYIQSVKEKIILKTKSERLSSKEPFLVQVRKASWAALKSLRLINDIRAEVTSRMLE